MAGVSVAAALPWSLRGESGFLVPSALGQHHGRLSMQRPFMIVAQCIILVLVLFNGARSDPPAKAPVLVPFSGALAPAAGTAVPFLGPGLTFATARIENGNVTIRELRLVPERVTTAAGNSDVFRPVHEQVTFPTERATFTRPNGDKLALDHVGTILANTKPVLIARHPGAIDPAYFELINPSAIVIVLNYHDRVPSRTLPSPPPPLEERK